MALSTPSFDPSRSALRGRLLRLAGAALVALALAACQADEMGLGSAPKHLREVPAATRAQMADLGMDESAPVLMRIFKEENAFEVWKQDRSGRYALLKEYEICQWSGELGPKFKEGDRQAPEGYYAITPGLMNPNSSYHLAFNTGYPNAFDSAHGRTGTHLMVHGACSSRGCYAMSDEQIQEIYAIARDAFRGGQKSFQLAAYPFRMTPENMARHLDSPHMPFWRMLKEGYDHFELTRAEPRVDVCGRKYVFNVTAEVPMSPAEACPALVQPEALRIAAEAKAAEDDARMMVIAAQLEQEKREAEEKAVLVAAREEERRRREEERRIALAEGRGGLAAWFGFGEEEEDATETASTVAVAEVAPAVEGPAPMPRPDPRGRSPLLAMAPTPPPSVVAGLFSYGDAGPTVAPAPAPVATAAPAPGGVEAGEVAPGAAGTVACAPGETQACLPQPVAGVVTASRVPDENQSIIDRIGDWF